MSIATKRATMKDKCLAIDIFALFPAGTHHALPELKIRASLRQITESSHLLQCIIGLQQSAEDLVLQSLAGLVFNKALWAASHSVQTLHPIHASTHHASP